MFQAKFVPSSIEVVDGKMTLGFNTGDIEVWLKQEVYILKSSGIMNIRIHDARILNDDVFVFESSSGKRIGYNARQVKSFNEMSKLLNKIVDSTVDRSLYIPILSTTESLIGEIMEFHKEKLIDRYLEDRNFEGISILLNEKTLKFYV